jgi:hypothetical protein
MSGSDPGSFGKLTIVAFVIPRDEAGMDALLKLKTVNIVEIHGRVDSINLRTALILSPAVITRNGFKGIALGQMKSANWVRSMMRENMRVEFTVAENISKARSVSCLKNKDQGCVISTTQSLF